MAEKKLDLEKAKKSSGEELVEELSTDKNNGLSKEEIEKRIEEYGYNEIVEEQESRLLKFLRNFWGPIPWMIEVAAILSAALRHWDDFVIITILLFFNAIVEFVQEFKADNAIAALKGRLASKSRAMRDGKWTEVEARDLVPGDIVRIRLGDIVPADVKLLSGDYLLIDEAALTGESLPVEKHVSDVAYSGSIVKQGEMNCLVFGTGLNTFFGKTAHLVAQAKTKSHFQEAVVKIGNYLILLNFFLVSIVLLASLFRHQPMMEEIQFALVLTVAAIPAALPVVMSVTMAVGAVKLSAKKAIVSKLVAIEEMAGMDILCSDKTGTITKNLLTVTGFTALEGIEEEKVLLFGGLASKSENNDPIDDAILAKAEENKEVNSQKNDYTLKDFKPFDPVSKRTEAHILFKDNLIKASKGAPQVVLALAKNKDEIKEKVTEMVDEAGKKGYRTLGVARTKESGDWEFLGLILLSDPPRDDSAETIKTAQELGVRVKMITGDHGAIAKETARQVNIGTNILSAEELSDTPDRKARRLVEEADGFSQVFPEHKYEIVELLQEQHHIVGMTGDGVNDAPALKKADAGIAVQGATDAARSAADIVFTGPGLSVIVDAIKESRRIFQRMQSYAIYRISETMDVLFFTVLAILIFGKRPVDAIMIVLLAVFNDFPIMAIAYDNVRYSREPEKWNMNKVIGIASVLGLTNVIFTFGMYYIGEHYLKLAPEVVSTLVFAELSIAGNLTIFLARTSGPLWSIAPGSALVWSTVISKGIVSAICAFGLFVAPIGKYIFLVWIYACIQMLITDRMKLVAHKLFDHNILFRRISKKPLHKRS